jgi:hypothetical protein
VAQKLLLQTPVPFRPRFPLATAGRQAAAAALVTLAALPAAAAPVAVGEDLPAPTLPLSATGPGPMDVARWVHDEAGRAIMSRSADVDRRDLLLQGWQPRPPTWIQAAALVNLGEYPSLDESVEKAERDLQTLTWVIEQQQREAAARAQRRAEDGDPLAEDDRWFLKLLPQHWIPLLKAHREWVIAGGTTLLLLVWAASAFARRPGAGATPPSAAADAPPKRRRRRHRRPRLQPQ